MKRTKLKDRKMPVYTRGEERFNMITHIVGVPVGIVALVLGIVLSAMHNNAAGIAGSIVFGVSMILLYTMSAIYHGLYDNMGKRVLQVLDHCTIYFLIAGTYTPILLSALRRVDPMAAWVLFGVVWALAILATVLTAIDLRKYRVFSMICYLGMGWCIIFRVPAVIEAMTMPGFILILSGGICYTVGSILYGLGRTKKWMHSIFHLFVLAGSICHLLAVLIFAI